eukprot:5413898-Amphidinium_carterae.1
MIKTRWNSTVQAHPMPMQWHCYATPHSSVKSDKHCHQVYVMFIRLPRRVLQQHDIVEEKRGNITCTSVMTPRTQSLKTHFHEHVAFASGVEYRTDELVLFLVKTAIMAFGLGAQHGSTLSLYIIGKCVTAHHAAHRRSLWSALPPGTQCHFNDVDCSQTFERVSYVATFVLASSADHKYKSCGVQYPDKACASSLVQTRKMSAIIVTAHVRLLHFNLFQLRWPTTSQITVSLRSYI